MGWVGWDGAECGDKGDVEIHVLLLNHPEKIISDGLKYDGPNEENLQGQRQALYHILRGDVGQIPRKRTVYVDMEDVNNYLAKNRPTEAFVNMKAPDPAEQERLRK